VCNDDDDDDDDDDDGGVGTGRCTVCVCPHDTICMSVDGAS
jgi:hypothetical protein